VTPLAKKLGIAAGGRVFTKQAPDSYTQMLAPIPSGVVFERKLTKRTNIVHVFSSRKVQLRAELKTLRNAINPSTAVWVSWPKKASKVLTDITDNAIREVALPLGFVDIKVCAVSEVWSGLKLILRKEYRSEGR
jgi:hypothetical protein